MPINSVNKGNDVPILNMGNKESVLPTFDAPVKYAQPSNSMSIDFDKYKDYVGTNSLALGEDFDKMRAVNQSHWSQAGGMLNKAIMGEILGGTIESLGAIPAYIEAKLNGDEADFSNGLTEFGQSIKDWASEATPIYRENPNASFDLGDPAWWFDNIPSVVSSVAMMLPGWGTGLLAEKMIARALKGLASMNKIAKTAKAAEEVIGAARSLSTMEKMLANAGKYSTTLGGVMGATVNAGTSRLLENTQESAGVAKQIHDETLESLSNMDDKQYAEFKKSKEYKTLADKLGKGDLTKEQIARGIGAQAGWKDWNDNKINLISDFLQALPMYRGIGAISTRTTEAVGKKLGIQAMHAQAESMGKALSKWDAFKGYANFGKVLALETISEGIEEGVNGISEKEGLYYGRYLMDNKKEDGDFQHRLGSYLKDPSIWEQAFWGSVGGLGMTGGVKVLNHVKDKIWQSTDPHNDALRASLIAARQSYFIAATAKIDNINSGIDPYDMDEKGQGKSYVTSDKEETAKRKEELLDAVEQEVTNNITFGALQFSDKSRKVAYGEGQAGTMDKAIEYLQSDGFKQTAKVMVTTGMTDEQIKAGEADGSIDTEVNKITNRMVNRMLDSEKTYRKVTRSLTNEPIDDLAKNILMRQYMDVRSSNNILKQRGARIQAQLESDKANNSFFKTEVSKLTADGKDPIGSYEQAVNSKLAKMLEAEASRPGTDPDVAAALKKRVEIINKELVDNHNTLGDKKVNVKAHGVTEQMLEDEAMVRAIKMVSDESTAVNEAILSNPKPAATKIKASVDDAAKKFIKDKENNLKTFKSNLDNNVKTTGDISTHQDQINKYKEELEELKNTGVTRFVNENRPEARNPAEEVAYFQKVVDLLQKNLDEAIARQAEMLANGKEKAESFITHLVDMLSGKISDEEVEKEIENNPMHESEEYIAIKDAAHLSAYHDGIDDLIDQIYMKHRQAILWYLDIADAFKVLGDDLWSAVSYNKALSNAKNLSKNDKVLTSLLGILSASGLNIDAVNAVTETMLGTGPSASSTMNNGNSGKLNSALENAINTTIEAIGTNDMSLLQFMDYFYNKYGIDLVTRMYPTLLALYTYGATKNIILNKNAGKEIRGYMTVDKLIKKIGVVETNNDETIDSTGGESATNLNPVYALNVFPRTTNNTEGDFELASDFDAEKIHAILNNAHAKTQVFLEVDKDVVDKVSGKKMYDMANGNPNTMPIRAYIIVDGKKVVIGHVSHFNSTNSKLQVVSSHQGIDYTAISDTAITNDWYDLLLKNVNNYGTFRTSLHTLFKLFTELKFDKNTNVSTLLKDSPELTKLLYKLINSHSLLSVNTDTLTGGKLQLDTEKGNKALLHILKVVFKGVTADQVDTSNIALNMQQWKSKMARDNANNNKIRGIFAANPNATYKTTISYISPGDLIQTYSKDKRSMDRPMSAVLNPEDVANVTIAFQEVGLGFIKVRNNRSLTNAETGEVIAVGKPVNSHMIWIDKGVTQSKPTKTGDGKAIIPISVFSATMKTLIGEIRKQQRSEARDQTPDELARDRGHQLTQKAKDIINQILDNYGARSTMTKADADVALVDQLKALEQIIHVSKNVSSKDNDLDSYVTVEDALNGGKKITIKSNGKLVSFFSLTDTTTGRTSGAASIFNEKTGKFENMIDEKKIAKLLVEQIQGLRINVVEENFKTYNGAQGAPRYVDPINPEYSYNSYKEYLIHTGILRTSIAAIKRNGKVVSRVTSNPGGKQINININSNIKETTVTQAQPKASKQSTAKTQTTQQKQASSDTHIVSNIHANIANTNKDILNKMVIQHIINLMNSKGVQMIDATKSVVTLHGQPAEAYALYLPKNWRGLEIDGKPFIARKGAIVITQDFLKKNPTEQSLDIIHELIHSMLQDIKTADNPNGMFTQAEADMIKAKLQNIHEEIINKIMIGDARDLITKDENGNDMRLGDDAMQLDNFLHIIGIQGNENETPTQVYDRLKKEGALTTVKLNQLEELVTYALTNDMFAHALNNMQSDTATTTKKESIWSKLLDTIKELFGIAVKDNSILSEIVTSLDNTTNPKPPSNTKAGETLDLFEDYDGDVPKSTTTVSFRDENNIIKYNGIIDNSKIVFAETPEDSNRLLEEGYEFIGNRDSELGNYPAYYKPSNIIDDKDVFERINKCK
jgi:hypothetical protein